MTTTTDTTALASYVEDMPLSDFWGRDYRRYALYTITDRAIPAAHDGMKPGQRRLLYSMYLNGNLPGTKYRKSAAVASTVTATLHPHGDAAMYDAAAQLAASYQRAALIDGHGAFPRVTGEVAASPRYTEMRLSEVAMELLREVADNTVPMVPSFDGDMGEPWVLPSRFPALLVNGCLGVAVGYSTSIPAHNPREVIAATRALIADPDLSDEKLLELLPGPDWNVDVTVLGTQGVRDYILTGKGNLTVRGRAEVTSKNTITITSLPPGVSVSAFREQLIKGTIRDSNGTVRLPGVRDLAVLSDRRQPVLLEVEVKKGHDPQEVLRSLLIYTPLETTIAPSLVAGDMERNPRWWTVRELIAAFLELRDDVVSRRAVHRRETAAKRQHLVRGLLLILADLDTAVAIIRASETDVEASEALQQKFGIDAVQAGRVLEMKLRSLTAQDAVKLHAEDRKLTDTIAESDLLIADPSARAAAIDADLVETSNLFEGAAYDRRTVLDADAEPTERPAPTGGSGAVGMSDKWRLSPHGLFGTDGDLLTDGLAWAAYTDGRIKVTDGKGLRRDPSKSVPVSPNLDGLLTCGVAPEGTHVLLVTRNGRGLRLDPHSINPQGVAGNGIAGVKLADAEDEVVAALPLSGEAGEAVLLRTEAGYKVLDPGDVPVKGRGGQGVGLYGSKTPEPVLSAAVSLTGFEIGGKVVSRSKRPTATVKKPDTDVLPA